MNKDLMEIEEMENRNYFNFIQLIFICGIAVWMTIIVTNHFFDYGTVYHVILAMFRMSKLIADPNIGNGIEWRSINWPIFAELSFNAIIFFQCIIVFFLWRATLTFIKSIMMNDEIIYMSALNQSNFAISLMIIMMLLFMCGGLFFGYWIEMGHVQDNHFNFLIMMLVGAASLNFNSNSCRESH